MTDKVAGDPQQVIADLERRLDELLAQQTATADVLKVISRSNFDLQTVLETLIKSAVELSGANRGSIFLREGDVFPLKAASSTTPEFLQYWAANPAKAGRGSATSRVIASGKVEIIPDVLDEPDIKMPSGSLSRIRATLGVPMLRNDKVEGVLVLTRPEPGPFTKSQIDLVQTFADQAMIAIENARLFDEVQTKTAGLQESLQHQTATSEVLAVISRSPGELNPVFQTILASATNICDAQFGLLLLYEDGGFRCASMFNLPPAFAETFSRNPVINPPPIDPLGRLIATLQLVHVVDVKEEPAYLTNFPPIVELVELGGARSLLLVPMLREKSLVGVIAIFRQTVHAFSDKQIDLVTSFGSQAVIAIENARLLNETKEALERQTATADILRVISQSPTDVRPVFDAIVLTAVRLFRCDLAFFLRCHGATFSQAALVGSEGSRMVPDLTPVPIDPDTNFPSRAIVSKKNLHLPDWSTIDLPEHERHIHEKYGINSSLFLPLLRAGECVGLLALARKRASIFGESEIALAESFRDQALIAIENTRLFNETQEALERQTATADILKVIASSPTDAQPVFEAIAERSKRLVDALSTTVFRLEDGVMHLRAFTSTDPEADVTLQSMFPAPLSNFSWGEAISRGEIYRVVDTELEIEAMRELARLRGFRSMLFVPLLRDRKPIGVIAVTREEPGPFIEHHVQQLQTFADQAVIAIENVRLFEQVQERTRELSLSLDELRTAQDRLVQTEKLASLGQLTAGIAHEIKNPLNFVNNFSALSGELIDELNELLGSAALDGKVREEIDELALMLKGNLEKVVQHGKRADSIVKNMLLHSREGSGERRPADINTIVEESLNLAYHGARAEKSGFNITLQRDLDPSAGVIDLYPQEITRVFLNLISNGFYAANKRREAGDNGFEPLLTATTKNLGNRVEIRIRDNGTGIPADVKEKMFNPFFTTKPAGEGTGLGLSMSHDIIVKQHGGRIDVETEPGAFTEFIITLPRAAART